MHKLDTTAGGNDVVTCTIKRAKVIGSWQFIPGTSANATTITDPPSTTPATRGWLFDASAAGDYANTNWTVNLCFQDSIAAGSVIYRAQLFVVTTNGTTVTKVSQVGTLLSSATVTPATANTRRTLTITAPGIITIAAGQYLYLELYLKQTVSSGSTTGTSRAVEDDASGTLQGDIVTPAFTAAPPAITGSGSLAIPRPGFASTGLLAFIGTAALAVAVALAGSGTVTPPPVTGSGSLAVSSPAIAASGTSTSSGFTGTGSLAVAQPTLAASGTNQQNVLGTGSLAVPQPSLAGSGGQLNTGTGTLAVASPALSGSGTNQQNVTGSASLTVPAPTISASGSEQQNVAGSGTLGIQSPQISGAGGSGAFVTGSGSLAIPEPSIAGSGAAQARITGAGSLALSVSLSGALELAAAPLSAARIAFLHDSTFRYLRYPRDRRYPH
jgi:hypothetical protein